MAILYVSAPTFKSDILVAERLKAENPDLMIGLCGAHVATLPEQSLAASDKVDFIARHEFDFTIQEVAEGKPFAEIDGITWRTDGEIVNNKDRALIHDMDSLPQVAPVYHRDLVVEDYFIGYLQVSLHVLLYGARLPLEMQLLPVAADHRRPCLPHPQRRSGGGRGRLHA